jgi:DUF2946 family protein
VLTKFLPIALIALLAQIIAPVAACWAAAIAASDPIGIVAICHENAAIHADQPGGQNGQHGGRCSICCLASANASMDTPRPVALGLPRRETARAAWHEQAVDLSALRVGSNVQARPPPLSM